MVKCKLCGEIFDESLNVCPLCGVGPDYFEPVEVEAKSGKVKCSICQAEFDATDTEMPRSAISFQSSGSVHTQ